MLALYRQLFAGLHQNDIDYAVWKNLQDMPAALMGNGDLDLYIPPGSHRSFIACLQLHGFTRVISHKSFPCVEHYYAYDAEADRFCHLHCYFRIVTGESHIKQFVVPVEQYISRLPNSPNAQGVKEMHLLLQTKLSIFRRKIKLSCVPGALLFLRERHGYKQEQRLLLQATKTAAGDKLRSGESGWLDDINESSSIPDEMLAGLVYRYRYRHWNRFSAFATPLYRYRAILLRILGKLRHSRKTFPVGFTIGVIGSHSDEIAILDKHLRDWLGSHFNVISRHSEDAYDSAGLPTESHVEGLTIQRLCSLVWKAWIRKYQARRAVRQALGGSVIIWQLPNQPTQELEQRLVSTEIEGVQKTLRSSIKQKLLQLCQELHKSNPPIDILLNLQCRKASVVDTSASIRPTEAQRTPARILQSSLMGTFDIAVDSDGIIDGPQAEHHRQHPSRWKKSLWEAALAIQY